MFRKLENQDNNLSILSPVSHYSVPQSINFSLQISQQQSIMLLLFLHLTQVMKTCFLPFKYQSFPSFSSIKKNLQEIKDRGCALKVEGLVAHFLSVSYQFHVHVFCHTYHHNSQIPHVSCFLHTYLTFPTRILLSPHISCFPHTYLAFPTRILLSPHISCFPHTYLAFPILTF